MIIYKTTNLLNGKIYIGKDKKNNPSYLGSGVLLKQSIKKYGKKNFVKEILEYCNSFDELNEKERYWISYYKSQDKLIGYNITDGGDGNTLKWNGDKLTDEHKIKISESLKKSENFKKSRSSEEFKQKCSNWQKGKKRSAEYLEKFNDSRNKILEIKNKQKKDNLSKVLEKNNFNILETSKELYNYYFSL